MRTAYLDCASGISGDMTLAALVDAGVPFEEIAAAVDSLQLPTCKLVRSTVKRRGFRATQITVEYEPQKKHRHLHHIVEIIDRSALTDAQKEKAKAIFRKLAAAEAKVHGSTLEKVHFHEVGAIDSIADIVGAAVGFDLLGAERVIASPVPTGCGMIDMDHGRLRSPAPATAELLAGIPLAESDVPFELTTPTGAAILATLVDGFGPLPAMTIRATGYGAGSRDLPTQPNILRLIVGDSIVGDSAAVPQGRATDRILVLETTLDDVAPTVLGHVFGLLLDAGALDVQISAVQMKKNRPGQTLRVLARPEDAPRCEELLFRETPTLGVRRWEAERTILVRESATVTTSWGPIPGKVVRPAPGLVRFRPETDACRSVAAAFKLPLQEVLSAAERAYVPAAPPAPGPTELPQP